MPTKKRNPRPTIDDLCVVCSQPYAQTHEIFSGTANRRISIEQGFQVKLCGYHHQRWKYAPHVKPYKSDIATPEAWFDKKLKQEWQTKYEREHTRQEFITLIGRSYL